jgi:hypothetical protein
METAQDFMSDVAWHPDGILALQVAAQEHLVKYFQVSSLNLFFNA